MADLKLTAKERAGILRRRAAADRQKMRGQKLTTQRAKPKGGRERDAEYMAWLHVDIPCIACIRFGRPAFVPNPIEAAHQKLTVAERGLQKTLGVRPSDKWCAPICAFHHRIGPPCCDPAQTKFWALVGLEPADVADLCAELFTAFTEGRPGASVIHQFARIAAQARAA